MEKKKIYISGPISGCDMRERKEAFEKAKLILDAIGYKAVNPLENGLPCNATTHEHMRRDIEILMGCDEIYMMSKWTHSAGCKLEFDIATAIGLTVRFEQALSVKFE